MDQMELTRKLATMTPAEAEEFLSTISITGEGCKLDGAITVTKNDEFDPASIDFVVCGFARPDAYRVNGAVDVACDDCGTMVIFSPASPKGKPRICFPCAQARINEEQSINE